MTLKAKHNRFESYEVYDEHGIAVGRVVLPKQRKFFGSDRGTVYLNRQPSLRRNSGNHRNKPRAA